MNKIIKNFFRYWKRRLKKRKAKGCNIKNIEHKRKSSTVLLIVSQKYSPTNMMILRRLVAEENDTLIDLSGPEFISTQDRFKKALTYLNSEEAKNEGCAIKYGYDYAWIQKAIVSRSFSGYERILNYSTPKFINYINSLGFTNIVKSKTIDKYRKLVIEHRNSPIPWDYSDCQDNVVEKNRRNKIVKAFIEIMNDI